VYSKRSQAERKAKAMLKILRSTKDGSVVLSVIGRIEEESLAELKRVMGSEAANHHLVLDLKDVTLADQAAIRYLVHCEAEGIVLENCPPYIRDWITAEESGRQGRTL
jgi:hypothetical protein